jgi:nucleolar protein 6
MPGEKPTVRLLTPKTTTDAGPEKTRGCAFVEFQTVPALQAALKLHESRVGKRGDFCLDHEPLRMDSDVGKSQAINVELSAGGGGKGALRQAKIESMRTKLAKQRERKTDEAKPKPDAENKSPKAREGGIAKNKKRLEKRKEEGVGKYGKRSRPYAPTGVNALRLG